MCIFCTRYDLTDDNWQYFDADAYYQTHKKSDNVKEIKDFFENVKKVSEKLSNIENVKSSQVTIEEYINNKNQEYMLESLIEDSIGSINSLIKQIKDINDRAMECRNYLLQVKKLLANEQSS